MKLGIFGENDSDLMTFGDAIKKAIALKSQAFNGDYLKLGIFRRKYSDIQSVDELAELYMIYGEHVEH